MGMTFTQQKSKLSRLLGDANTSSDDAWPLADREFEINRGELMFAKDSKSLFKQTTGTVSGQAISLPSDYYGMHILVVDDIVLTNDQEMPLADYGRFIDSGDDRYYFWVNTSGTRQINFIDANTNSKTYRLYYFGKPTTDLSADADESPFQDEYRECSVYYAAAQLLPQVGKTQLAVYYQQQYDQIAAEARRISEERVKSVIKAMPDILATTQFDRDIQGIGQQNGCW